MRARKLRNDGVGAADLLKIGYTPLVLLKCGYDEPELIDAEVNQVILDQAKEVPPGDY